MSFNKIPFKYIDLPDGTHDNMLLRYNPTTDEWEAVDYLLEYLSDMGIVNPADKDILVYNASIPAWENRTIAEAGIQGDNLGNHIAEKELDMAGFKIENLLPGTELTDAATYGQFLNHLHEISQVNNLQTEIDNINNLINNQLLNDHDDVEIVSPTVNDMIRYGGSLLGWQNINISNITKIVGDTSLANINMNNFNINTMADGVAPNDAVNKGQLDLTRDEIEDDVTAQILNDHFDVLLAGVQNQSLLVFNSSNLKWENKTPTELSITGDNLGDHTATQNLNMTLFNINNLANGAAANDAINKGQLDALKVELDDALDDQELNDHTDVTITSLADEDFLRYNGAGQWENVSIDINGDNLGNHIATETLKMAGYRVTNMGVGTLSTDGANKSQLDTVINSINNQVLNEHDDVVISGPSTGQFLRYNGIDWVNDSLVIPGGDNLGNHIATEALQMTGNKVTGMANATSTLDGVNLGQLNAVYNIVNNKFDSQTLTQHTDVNISAPDNLDILRYNSSTQDWENVSSASISDNLGNHIATQHLNMNTNNRVINLAAPVNNADAMRKLELDNHTHTWPQINKSGSLLTHIDDVNNSLAKSNRMVLYWDSSLGKWSTDYAVSVSATEPATFIGKQWHVKNASGTLNTKYNARLLTCVDFANYGSLNNTWYTCDGQLVDITLPTEFGFTAGGFNGGTGLTIIDKIDFATTTGTAVLAGYMSSGRFGLAGSQSASHGYMYAGSLDPTVGGATRVIEKIDFTSNSVSTLSSQTSKLLFKISTCGASSSSLNRGYILGGKHNIGLDTWRTSDIEKIYHSVDSTTVMSTKLNVPIIPAAVVSDQTNNRAYACAGNWGGAYEELFTNVISKFDYSTDVVTDIFGYVPVQLAWATGIAGSSTGYICGGAVVSAGTYTYLNKCFSLNYSTGTCTFVGDLSVNRMWPSGYENPGDRGFICGGEELGETGFKNTIEYFTLDVGIFTLSPYGNMTGTKSRSAGNAS